MAPLLLGLAAGARRLFSRAVGSTSTQENALASLKQLRSTVVSHTVLVARQEDNKPKVDPSRGVIDPHHINNTAIFVLFGLIGLALVCTGVWFFFWAKNGGFVFKENDWEEYKSTVLRRTGPNGTLLSGATKSTNLGGGSVYKDYEHQNTAYTGASTEMNTHDTGSTLSGITAGASDLAGREKRRQKREKRERLERDKEKKKNRRHGRKAGGEEEGVLVDDAAEAAADSHLRQYRHEKPARVGGLNKESEGISWDGSINPAESSTASSGLLFDRQSTPTNSPVKKAGGIRKVYSTADHNAAREAERIRAEAGRLQEKGRAAGRRDFSFQPAASSTGRSNVTGSTITEDSESGDIGTKAYRHIIPGLSSSSGAPTDLSGTDIVDYAHEKRRQRGGAGAGYRRGRDSEL